MKTINRFSSCATKVYCTKLPYYNINRHISLTGFYAFDDIVLKEFSLNLTWICIKCVSLIHTSQYVVLLQFIETFANNSDIFRSLTLYHAYGLYNCKRNEEALEIVNNFFAKPFKKHKKKKAAFLFGLSKDDMIALQLLKSQLVCNFIVST